MRRLIITMMKPLKIDKGSGKNSHRIKMMLKRGGGAGVSVLAGWFCDDSWQKTMEGRE
jgi:hypothetical protein